MLQNLITRILHKTARTIVGLSMFVFCTMPNSAFSAQIQNGSTSTQITIVDTQGRLLNNIVVELSALETDSTNTSLQEDHTPNLTVMEQINQQFVPHILAVPAGTHVSFPDTDTVRHHVYSFSKAKSFEIAISQQSIPSSIVFEKAGIVELGCNIHDWMLGYIYVAESPFFTQTNEAGNAIFSSLESGEYEVKIWHPRLHQKDLQKTYKLNITSKQVNQLTITLTHKLIPSYAEFDNVHGLGEYE